MSTFFVLQCNGTDIFRHFGDDCGKLSIVPLGKIEKLDNFENKKIFFFKNMVIDVKKMGKDIITIQFYV